MAPPHDQRTSRRLLGAAVGAQVVVALAAIILHLAASSARAHFAAYLVLGAVVPAVASMLVLHRSLSSSTTRQGGPHTTPAAEGAADWMWAADADGLIVSSDARVESLLGYRIDDVVGKDVFRLVHADERGRARQRVDAALAAGEGWSDWLLRLAHRDGTDRWVQSYATPVVDDDGVVVGFRGSSHDATSAILAERAELASHDGLGAKRARIQAILDHPQAHLRTVFQPIVALDGTIAGVEALSRFAMQPARTPDCWFAEADEIGLGAELEMLAVATALSHLEQLPDGYVAVNVSPTTVLHPLFRELLDHATVPATRLVIELTEHIAVAGYDELRAVLTDLRSRGVRIAIDDAGSGYASLSHILELRPDVIKLDRGMVVGISEDPARRILAAALVDVARLIGASVVAEGVEDLASLNAARVAGIGLAQGFLFGTPEPPPISLHGSVEGSGHRAIVIDDDPVVRLLVSRMARRAGIEVVGQASDGAEGIRLADALAPDVIVLDLAMPVMRGEDALPEIRRLLPDTFVVVLSATADVDLAAAVLGRGADAYVGKDEAAIRLAEVFAGVLARPLPAHR